MTTLAFSSGTREIKNLYLHEPQGAPRAVVQVLHGIAEHCGRYEEFANELAAHGYVVARYDHIGHGLQTPKEQLGSFGEHNGWQKLVYDVDTVHTVLRQRYPNARQVLLGHSMGSFLAREYVIQFSGAGLSGLVLSGTGNQPLALVKSGLMLAKAAALINGKHRPAHLLQKVTFSGYNKRFSPARTPNDWLTRDAAAVDAYNADPFCGFPLTAHGYRDFFQGLAYLADTSRLKDVPKELPVYLFSGASDPVGRQGEGVKEAALQYERAGLKDVTVRLYEGGGHEMLNEINRDEVVQDLLDWLDR